MKKEFLWFIFLFSVFYCSSLTAQTTTIPKVLKPDYNWIILSFLALVVVGLIGTIGYMLGGFFGDRVKAYSKNMIYSVIKSAIIIIIIVTLFLFFDNQILAPSFIFNIFSIELTIEYAKVIRATLINLFASMTAITTLFSFLGNIAPYFRPAGIIGISFSIAPAFRPFFDITGILLSAISASTAVWFGQIWFLNFIYTKMFSLFLPLGIFLRATKFEGIGNALIALSIGFFFIYPFLLNFSFDIFNAYIKIQAGSGYIITSTDGKTFSEVETCIKYKLNELIKGNKVECTIEAEARFFKFIQDSLFSFTDFFKNDPLFMFLSFIFLLVSRSFFSFLLFLSVFALLLFIKITIDYVAVLSLLLPALVIFLTFLSIDEISKFLGTEIDISAFEKIF